MIDAIAGHLQLERANRGVARRAITGAEQPARQGRVVIQVERATQKLSQTGDAAVPPDHELGAITRGARQRSAQHPERHRSDHDRFHLHDARRPATDAHRQPNQRQRAQRRDTGRCDLMHGREREMRGQEAGQRRHQNRRYREPTLQRFRQRLEQPRQPVAQRKLRNEQQAHATEAPGRAHALDLARKFRRFQEQHAIDRPQQHDGDDRKGDRREHAGRRRQPTSHAPPIQQGHHTRQHATENAQQPRQHRKQPQRHQPRADGTHERDRDQQHLEQGQHDGCRRVARPPRQEVLPANDAPCLTELGFDARDRLLHLGQVLDELGFGGAQAIERGLVERS